MPTTASHKSDKVQLSVRVEDRVMGLLDAEVAQARSAGSKITKERLVSDAVTAAHGDHRPTRPHGWLPEHHATLLVDVDPCSSTALLDIQDNLEASA